MTKSEWNHTKLWRYIFDIKNQLKFQAIMKSELEFGVSTWNKPYIRILPAFHAAKKLLP